MDRRLANSQHIRRIHVSTSRPNTPSQPCPRGFGRRQERAPHHARPLCFSDTALKSVGLTRRGAFLSFFLDKVQKSVNAAPTQGQAARGRTNTSTQHKSGCTIPNGATCSQKHAACLGTLCQTTTAPAATARIGCRSPTTKEPQKPAPLEHTACTTKSTA